MHPRRRDYTAGAEGDAGDSAEREGHVDAELCGVRCFLEVKPMSFCDFYQRFAPRYDGIELDAD